MKVTVMLNCPKCSAENDDGKKTCAKCGCKLENKKVQSVNDKEEFLISVRDGYEADMVEGCLRSAEIPFLKKGHGPAGFARYDTKYESAGVDFYVPSKILNKAIAALPPVEGAEELQKALSEKENDGSTDKQTSQESQQAPSDENPIKRTLTVILLLAIMAAIIFGVDAVMNLIRGMMGY